MLNTLSAPYKLRDNDIIMGENPSQYILRVRDLPLDEKPREKLLKVGPQNLNSSELMAVLLGVGTKKEEVLSMAQRILKEYGHQAMIRETNPKVLAETLQIPIGKACQIIASFELGRRFFDTQAGKPVVVRTAEQAYTHLKDMGNLPKEQLRGLYLNSRYQVVHEEVISVGSLTANIVHPREVFQPALEYNAVAIIIAHNHPSCTTEPTEADIATTRQLIDAGQIMGIDVLDHLVITVNAYVSILEEYL
jgi:DNA repair protein RadC